MTMSRLSRQFRAMVAGDHERGATASEGGTTDAGPSSAEGAQNHEPMLEPNWSSVAAVAVEVWRLGQRVQRLPQPDAPVYQPLRNSVERLTYALGELGVTFEDPLGTAFDPRSSLEVAHADLPAGSIDSDERLIVTETISPEIRHAGRVIRHGRVVVGRQPTPTEIPPPEAQDGGGTHP